MRTTLTIDDDILALARERARAERKAIGDVVSDLARRGLDRERDESADRKPTDAPVGRGGFPVLPSRPGGRVVTLEIVNALRDEAP